MAMGRKAYQLKKCKYPLMEVTPGQMPILRRVKRPQKMKKFSAGASGVMNIISNQASKFFSPWSELFLETALSKKANGKTCLT